MPHTSTALAGKTAASARQMMYYSSTLVSLLILREVFKFKLPDSDENVPVMVRMCHRCSEDSSDRDGRSTARRGLAPVLVVAQELRHLGSESVISRSAQ